MAIETTTALPPPTPGLRVRMSYEKFLAWAGEDVHAEWVNGEVNVYMTATVSHQRLAEFLSQLIQLFVEAAELGEVLAGPVQVKLSPGGSGREPDVFFVAKERQGQLREKFFEGAPDLVIEVVSDESASRDRVDKFKEYEEAGVREYWIVDPRPRRRRADFYQLARTASISRCPPPTAFIAPPCCPASGCASSGYGRSRCLNCCPRSRSFRKRRPESAPCTSETRFLEETGFLGLISCPPVTL